MVFTTSVWSKDTNFASYPQFSYSDETGFMAGIISYLRFRLDNYPPEIPKQDITTNVVYSAKKQFAFRLMPVLYSPYGKYQLEAKFDYDYWPTEFFGVGNKDYDIEPEDRFNLRLDFGFCKDDSNFEISGGEAF